MLHCDNQTLSILDEWIEAEDEARMEAEDEAKQARAAARVAAVLIHGDHRVTGLSAVARELRKSPQTLRYGLKHHPELGFIRWVGLKPEAMVSSLQNIRQKQLVESRVRQEQVDRGRARGKANDRNRIFHVSGPRNPKG